MQSVLMTSLVAKSYNFLVFLFLLWSSGLPYHDKLTVDFQPVFNVLSQ